MSFAIATPILKTKTFPLHPVKKGRVTVAGKPSKDVTPGTLGSILKQVGFKD
jgi:predicted RNA binding protein YcfA (HicA-like mRNA interferase family)